LCYNDAVVLLLNRAIGPAKRYITAKHPNVLNEEEEGVEEADEQVIGLIQRANIS
jgi:hypothetical protein